VLASTFIVIEILVEAAIALAASRVQPFLARFGKRVNRVLGLLFMAIGIFLPLR
jgi:threonine/homoserine/homoserine lactone efflux protein